MTKKRLKIFGIFLLLLVGFLISIPIFFQDKIVDLVKQTINKNVNAKVEFANADLSFLRNFPNASIKLSDVSVVNFEPFKDDTLFYGKEVNLKLNISELFKNTDENLNINSFNIDKAFVNIITNKKGNSNYNIAKKPDTVATEKTADTTSASNFGLSVKQYSITNSEIKYTDTSSKIKLHLIDFNHSGKGDFSENVFDLETKTSSLISYEMDGNSYAKNQKISLNALLAIDVEKMKFSFLKNEAKLNELLLTFNGFIQVNKNDQDVALNFKTPSSNFKNFLGLIPKKYAKNIADVSTTGNFSVNGKVEGKITKNTIPKIDIKIASNNASFKYPNLPKRVENIHIDAQIKNETGNVKTTFVNFNKFSFKIDEDVFSGNGKISNLTTNPYINAKLNGTLNLAHLDKAYPIELDNNLSGILQANLATQFDVDAIKNNKVNRIKNNGTASLSNFIYSSKDVVNPINISTAKVNFSSAKVSLTKFNAVTGKSDMNATGTLNNFFNFLLSDGKLQGNFIVNSNEFRVSDFMEVTDASDKKSSENSEETPQSTSKETLKIPAFLDCTINANAKTVHYDNLVLNNVKGKLILKDEKASLSNVNAGIFGGKIALNGEVNTQKKQPTFAMKLGVKSFDISQSFTNLNLLQNLAPIANAMNGKLNTDINLTGNLNNDFSPNLTSVSGNALAEVLGSKINTEDAKSLNLLNDKLSFIDLSKLDLSNLKANLSFKDGQVAVNPFDLKYQDIGITVGGTHGFDQSMNYNITFNVPAKYLGNDVQNLLTKLSPGDQNITVPITANITGNMESPSVKTDLSSAVTNLTQQLIKKQKDNLIKNTLGGLLGGGKKDNKTPKDSTRTNPDKKDETVKTVTNILGGLFGKKKTKKDTVK